MGSLRLFGRAVSYKKGDGIGTATARPDMQENADRNLHTPALTGANPEGFGRVFRVSGIAESAIHDRHAARYRQNTFQPQISSNLAKRPGTTFLAVRGRSDAPSWRHGTATIPPENCEKCRPLHPVGNPQPTPRRTKKELRPLFRSVSLPRMLRSASLAWRGAARRVRPPPAKLRSLPCATLRPLCDPY